MPDKHYRLGCDIGGTFTDFVLLNDQTGEIKTGKCLTTPGDPSDAVEEGIRALEATTPDFVAGLDELIHGTTLVINAIIERKGAKTGLITTQGFRDVLEIGREMRYAPYDLFAEFPQPLIPRRYRLEVDERVRSDGTVLKALDPDGARQVVRTLLGLGVESIAVCLLNSFENPAHELLLQEIIEQEAPGLSVSISYRVLPQIKEYERTSTTVTNAYVKPLTGQVSVQAGRPTGGHRFSGASSLSCFRAAALPLWKRRPSFRCGSSSPGPPRRSLPVNTTVSTSIFRKCSASTWAGPPPSPA